MSLLVSVSTLCAWSFRLSGTDLAVLALPHKVCLPTATLLLVHFLKLVSVTGDEKSKASRSYMAVDGDPVRVNFTT